jgi:zinc transport system ATP-binding protein
MIETLLATEGLGIRLGNHDVLSGISLRLNRGEIVTIVGPNGSGKTTLLRLIIGALTPTQGTIWRAAGLRLGYVPQRLAIDHTLPITVDRFLALSAAGRSDRGAALERVGVPAVGARQVIDLSGGQFQRVLLAQALLGKPDLLVLDEAAQGLDQPGIAKFYRLIGDLRDEFGCAVLMVSHDLHVVMSASDRVICLNGHVCCEGTPLVVSAAPEYRALFGLGTEGELALYRHEHNHSHGGGAAGHHHVHADPGA